MSVLVDEHTRLAVAGITGREGSFHTLNNRAYGTAVVGGVTPGKGGQDVEGIPVFDSWQQAMAESDRIALGRVVMHTRERLLAIEPRGKGLIAYTLRMDNEVRDPDDAFSAIPNATPDRQMTAIAEKIIEQKEGRFEPAEFVDRYETALKALIKEKQKGQKPVRAAEPGDTNVIDLMAALKRSLKGGSATRSRKPAAKKTRARAR